jgi:DNA gyrase subunit B
MEESEEMKERQAQTGEYGADNITALEGLEAVRKRPAMYIGGTDIRGLHHLVWEVVDNSIDEHLAGYCRNIDIVIHKDNSISVTDDGRGIPTGMHAKLKKSALEVVLTVLHAGGKFDKDTYKVSGGLHGVGVSCVNALSIHLRAEVHREGKIFEQEFSKGIPLYSARVIGDSDKTGTTITFKPDAEIFDAEAMVFKHETLSHRFREMAFLNSGLYLNIALNNTFPKTV